VRFRNTTKHNINASVESHKNFDNSSKIIKSVLFLTFKQLSFLRSLAKFLNIFARKHSDKNVGMNFCQFVLFFIILNDC